MVFRVPGLHVGSDAVFNYRPKIWLLHFSQFPDTLIRGHSSFGRKVGEMNIMYAGVVMAEY